MDNSSSILTADRPMTEAGTNQETECLPTPHALVDLIVLQQVISKNMNKLSCLFPTCNSSDKTQQAINVDLAAIQKEIFDHQPEVEALSAWAAALPDRSHTIAPTAKLPANSPAMPLMTNPNQLAIDTLSIWMQQLQPTYSCVNDAITMSYTGSPLTLAPFLVV